MAAHPNTAQLPEPPFWDGEAAVDIFGAIVRQAIHDYLHDFHRASTPDAATFLRQCGLLDASGNIDAHGYTVPVLIKRRRKI